MFLITHYQRLLDYITPDYIHIMQDGKITKYSRELQFDDVRKFRFDWAIPELMLAMNTKQTANPVSSSTFYQHLILNYL